MPHFIGVDLGGTHLRAAVVETASGEVVASRKTNTPAFQGPQSVMEAIADLVRSVISSSKVNLSDLSAMGLGIPGLVDMENGIALLLPNIPGDWRSVPLAASLSQALHLPVHLINDSRAITLGEYTFGTGRGVETMACYAVGTGIGGGVVINGRLHLGLSGSAGELGHLQVELNGLECNCGGRGCLEMYASGPAIAGNAVKAVVQRRPTLISSLVRNDLNRINVEVVLQAARQGDALACDLFHQAGVYIGMAVANTLHTISPERVVFGGGVSAAGELLLEPVRQTVRQRVHLVPVDRVEIVLAALGDQAGLLGSALWAEQCFQSSH
jgi:glucokinase